MVTVRYSELKKSPILATLAFMVQRWWILLNRYYIFYSNIPRDAWWSFWKVSRVVSFDILSVLLHMHISNETYFMYTEWDVKPFLSHFFSLMNLERTHFLSTVYAVLRFWQNFLKLYFEDESVMKHNNKLKPLINEKIHRAQKPKN